MMGTHVLAAPALDPGSARVELMLPEGLTIGEIVSAALPGLADAEAARTRVTLVTEMGSAPIPAHLWHVVRPRPGVQVVIRVIPGKDALRSILSIVVSIAAFALGSVFGPGLASLIGVSSGVGSALVGLGVTMLGNLLINALIPPVKPDNETKNSYSISGWRNRMTPDGAVPVVLGQIRYAPPFAASSWTEIVGDLQYLRTLFCFGEGPVELTDFRIGDTSIAEYDEVEIEVRQGMSSDLPCSLYPRQIYEETIGVELTRPLPRDDLGEVISGAPTEETPVVRTTGADASAASVIIAFPGGLIAFDNKGRKLATAVSIRIEQRLVQDAAWTLVTTLDVSARKPEAFYRQHSWSFPSRGRWQIRLTMLTDETENSQVQQRTVWAALQTMRPEYPLAYSRPLALVAMRVKATHQLSGALDNFSALARRVCLDWDAATSTWTERVTSNPASLFRFALQSPANFKPAIDAEIDLKQLQDWHEFCALKGLHYNRVHDQAGTTLREVLTEIAAAGRATPRHDGLRWGVVIDRPAGLIVDHINPRNSWDVSVRRAYVEKPHAWICKFQDEDNDFKEAQRVIRRPGYVGDIILTETLEQPGLTNAAIVWREGLRRFYEAEYRPDAIQVTQEGAARVATRGDAVMLSHDVLSRTQWAGRVLAVDGNAVELDGAVTMSAGRSYALRWQHYTAANTIGMSVVRQVATRRGESQMVVMSGGELAPKPGDIVHFGEYGQDSMQLVVTGLEATEDQCTIVRAVAAAPEIDLLTDSAEIPAWSSRVGVEINPDLLQPPTPRFASIVSGVAGAGSSGKITYLIEPGSGPVATASFKVSHRLGTSGAWTDVTVPAANGGGSITGYANGATVQLQAVAVSMTGVPSLASAAITLVVGAGDAPIPLALETDAVSITTLLGGALIQLATGSDADIAQVQIYRSTSAVLNRATDATGAPNPVGPLQSFSFALGDTTRTNLVASGSMDTPAAWSLGTGWSISGGKASHVSGTAASLAQAISLVSGKWYRLGLAVSGLTAGTLTPRLTGGTTVSAAAISANGSPRARLQAVTGNTHLSLAASATLVASVDDVVVYQETAACLAQGAHYIWIEPQNDDGVPGPISGPYTVNII